MDDEPEEAISYPPYLLFCFPPDLLYKHRMAKLTSEREIPCPCCGAVLTIDLNLGRLVSHEAPPNPDRPELDNAQRILAEQAAKRDALFEQSFQNEKNKGDALSKRFEEALREAKKEPVTKPLRGFDLD